jgi:hypothetical protein
MQRLDVIMTVYTNLYCCYKARLLTKRCALGQRRPPIIRVLDAHYGDSIVYIIAGSTIDGKFLLLNQLLSLWRYQDKITLPSGCIATHYRRCQRYAQDLNCLFIIAIYGL